MENWPAFSNVSALVCLPLLRLRRLFGQKKKKDKKKEKIVVALADPGARHMFCRRCPALSAALTSRFGQKGKKKKKQIVVLHHLVCRPHQPLLLANMPHSPRHGRAQCQIDLRERERER